MAHGPSATSAGIFSIVLQWKCARCRSGDIIIAIPKNLLRRGRLHDCKMCFDYRGFKLVSATYMLEKKNETFYQGLSSSTQLENRWFYVLNCTRTASNCTKVKNAREEHAKRTRFLLLNMQNTDVLSSSSSRLLKLSIVIVIAQLVYGLPYGKHCISPSTEAKSC